MNVRQKIAEAELTLTRLNDDWSFADRQLSWRVPVYISWPYGNNLRNRLLNVVRAYGALARAAGEEMLIFPITEEWDRLFKGVGQMLMFEIPDNIGDFKSIGFESESAKAFMNGWEGGFPP